MVLMYDPGKYMPQSTDDFREVSWMATWDTGPWHLHDVEPGGTVFLVRAGPTQEVVWKTRVTQSFGVPYEAVNDLANEVLRRWGLVIETPKMDPGGYCIGWRAEPIVRLDRGPHPLPDHMVPADGEVLDLDGFQDSDEMSAAFRHRWGVASEPEVMCSGRPMMGWYGPSP